MGTAIPLPGTISVYMIVVNTLNESVWRVWQLGHNAERTCVELKEIKPRLTLTNQFVIPAPYRAWCHLCERGFLSLTESQKHDREAVHEHEVKQQARTGS